MGRPEIWAVCSTDPSTARERAVLLERWGFDGIAISDSQNARGDLTVALALATSSTTRLLIASGVTNLYTRHPAVVASAFATLQAISGGRLVLGVGRGDSALASLGVGPMPVTVFSTYLAVLQAYLRGEEIPFDTLESVGLMRGLPRCVGDRVTSRLEWLSSSVPKVPVDVAASGPKVISLGASVAERVTFAIGADPARVSWAVNEALQACSRADRDSSSLSLGAYINIALDDDPERARQLGRGRLVRVAHLSVLGGQIAGPTSKADRSGFEQLARLDPQKGHGGPGEIPELEALPDAFADSFGVYGSAAYCAQRIQALIDLGIDRIVLFPPAESDDPEASWIERIGGEVIPFLQARAS